MATVNGECEADDGHKDNETDPEAIGLLRTWICEETDVPSFYGKLFF